MGCSEGPAIRDVLVTRKRYGAEIRRAPAASMCGIAQTCPGGRRDIALVADLSRT